MYTCVDLNRSDWERSFDFYRCETEDAPCRYAASTREAAVGGSGQGSFAG